MLTKTQAKALTVAFLLAGPGISCSPRDTQNRPTVPSTPADPRLQEVRQFVIEDVATGITPSLSIAVAHNGQVVWAEAFGWADKENKIQATPDTMYRLGSISKPITATAVMRLVEAGLVDLDAPVEEHLGGLTLHYYAGTPEEVTVRRVMQNRAGLPPHDQAFYLDEEPERRPFDETVRRYGNVMFKPGWSFIYSNLGYQLLARVVEEATGKDFPGYVRDSVFTPLGMAAAQVYVAGDELQGPAATLYYGVNGQPVPRSTSAYPGSGDVYCSAHDLLRFAMFHLKNHLPDQAGVLADSTLDEMHSAGPPSNTFRGDEYGLGWWIDVDELEIRSIYHGGQTTGLGNFMVLVPSENLALVILSNTDYDAGRLLHIQGAIRAALIPGYDFNPWALAAEDQTETESDASEAQAQDEAPTQQFPEELLGKWEGRIVTYDREIDVSLVLSNDEGARIRLSGQEECGVDFSVISSVFLFGTFQGSIPTPDIARYDNWVRLAVRHTGNKLSGQATAVGWREDRQTHCELSSWIELVRQVQ
jgi:CubicO group peptidase (beta-lactamase class C family)